MQQYTYMSYRLLVGDIRKKYDLRKVITWEKANIMHISNLKKVG